jgi:hypothetical protein
MIFKESILVGNEIFSYDYWNEDTKYPIFYLQEYHPYYKGKNPLFDRDSARILDFKAANQDAVNYYKNKLIGILGNNFVIATIPSHDSAVARQATTLLVEELRNVNPSIIDGTSCITRHTTIPKLALSSGFREPDVLRSSLILQNHQILDEQDVLVLDDVTTSGNSLFVGAEFVRNKANPKSILMLALGRAVQP